MHVLEVQGFLVQHWLAPRWGVLPRRGIRELVVVAQRLALVGLVLDTEMTAARLLAVQGVTTHERGELEEVGYPSRLFERLVERVFGTEDPQVFLELLA